MGIVSKGKEVESGESEVMNEFFQDVGAIKTAMGNIRRNIKSIEEKYVQSINSINIEQGNSIFTYLNPLVRNITTGYCFVITSIITIPFVLSS